MLAALIVGCSTAPRASESTNPIPASLLNAVRGVTNQLAPDGHMAVCRIEVHRQWHGYVLGGYVGSVAAKRAVDEAAGRTGLPVDDQIEVLPESKLGDRVWGIATLSVVNVREKPANAGEMGTQMLTGEVFKVWKKQTNWYLVQTPDGYVGWVEGGGFANGTREDVDRWNAAPRLIVTAYEERIVAEPNPGAATVSDVVMACQVKRVGESGDWDKVELADGRSGYLPKKSVMDYAAWLASRQPTAENIELTARAFLGRPYSWGCNSIRGMDCSGLTKFVFLLNGIQLYRNASEQCRQGVEVPLDDDYSHLKKGDLLFFGRGARGDRPETISHTAIYLGDKLFIQASERVQISSLDSASPLRDERRIRSLLHARRILPE